MYDAPPPPPASLLIDAERPPSNPYPAPIGGDVPADNRLHSATAQPRLALDFHPAEQLAEQLAEAHAALAEARCAPTPRSSAEPVVLVVGMLDGGCVCGGGGSLHKRCNRCARWIFPLVSVTTLVVFVVAQILNQGIVWLTVDAAPIRLLLPNGLHLQEAAMNATYWESIQDGWDAGAPVSTVMNAVATGVMPAIALVALNVCWFFQSPQVCGGRGLFSILIGAVMQCSKTSSWFLIFSFVQALSFQYSLVFDWNDHPIDIKMDIAATSGAYAMICAILMFQMCSTGIFIADQAMLHAARSAEEMLQAERGPLFATCWKSMTGRWGPADGCGWSAMAWTVMAAVTQIGVAALIFGTPYLTW